MSVYPMYMYPLCSCFRICHTAWECLSTSCFSRLQVMIGCIFLKATKTMIINVVRDKNDQSSPSPILCSLKHFLVSSVGYIFLFPAFLFLWWEFSLPRTKGIRNASLPKLRLIFTNGLKSSCCCNTVPPYCAFLHLSVRKHLFIRVIASEFTCSARLFVSICLDFCTTRCKK